MPSDPSPRECERASLLTWRMRSESLARGADQLCGIAGIPRSCPRPLAALAQATEPEGQCDIRTDEEAGKRLAPETAYPSSVAARPLRRQTPKVGAVCGNPARTRFCAGGTR